MADEFTQDEPQAVDPLTPEPDVDADEPEALPASIQASDDDGDGVVEKEEVHVTDASDDDYPAPVEESVAPEDPLVEGSGEPEYVPEDDATVVPGEEPVPEDVQNGTTSTEDSQEAVESDSHPAESAEPAPVEPEYEPTGDAGEEVGDEAPVVGPEDTLTPSEDPAYATVGQEAVGEAPVPDEVRVDVSPETAALGPEAVEEAIAAEQATPVSDLPPSLQAEAAGKTGEPHPSLPGREAAGEETPLQQRPVEELDGYAAEQNVLTDDGTTINPGSYHKPGAALPPETEEEQDLQRVTDEDAAQARVDKYEGFADEDVPEDVAVAREEQAATADVDGPQGHVPTASETAPGTEPDAPAAEEDEAPADEALQVEVGDFDNDGDLDIREKE